MNLADLLAQQKWDKRQLENLLNRMSEEGLIEAIGMGGLFYQITAIGIVSAERLGIAPTLAYPYGLIAANEHEDLQHNLNGISSACDRCRNFNPVRSIDHHCHRPR